MGMLLTQAGQNAINALLASDGTLTIAEMSFGSDDRHPTGGEVALTTELIRKPVLNKTVDAEKTRFDARLEHDEGPFVIHEIGLHDEAGTLIFIGRVEGLTKLVTAGEAHSIDVSANVFTSNFQNVVVEVDSNFAFVPATRKIDAGTGLTGGGDFSDDRTLAVDFATEAEAAAGVKTTKVMSPKSVADQLVNVVTKAGAQTITGVKTFKQTKFLTAIGQTAPSVELTGFTGQVNGFYAVDGGVRLALDSGAILDFGYDGVMRPTSVGNPYQIDGAMLRNAVREVKGDPGLIELPGGSIMQYGTASNGTAALNVLFPEAFPSACVSVQITSYFGVNTRISAFNVGAKSTTGFTVIREIILAGNTGFSWVAWGY